MMAGKGKWAGYGEWNKVKKKFFALRKDVKGGKYKDTIKPHFTPSDSSLNEENPFAAAAKKDDGGGEAPKDDGGGEEEKDDKKKKKPEPESDALSVKFEPARVKSYNDKNFKSTSGEVTKITKDGMTVKVKPDNVDVHVNFDDISESVKSFFKK